MNFYCFRCGKNFWRKYDLKRHLLERVTACKVRYLNIPRENAFMYYSDNYEDFVDKLNESGVDLEDLDVAKPHVIKKYECEDCGGIFSHKKSYHRHRKHNCNSIKKQKLIKYEDELIEHKYKINYLEQKIGKLEQYNEKIEQDNEKLNDKLEKWDNIINENSELKSLFYKEIEE